MRSPKISVLLVVKNALPLLSGALNSLKHQTFKDFEIVVADGASIDGTVDVLREAAKELQLRIVSESDRSVADGTEKGLAYVTGDILATLCADERYYPSTLEQVVKWFEAEPNAVMCGGKVDFIDEHDKVVGSHLTAPFNLPGHLACELVPSILSSFFNRALIGEDFRFASDVPTCADYEFWGRLGFRFPPSAFKRYDVSVAQAYRTRDSMSFRAESFTQMCHDKLTHLNNLLAKGYATGDVEGLRRRSSAGIHMWAAEQLTDIEPDHPDILAHCAAAARYDKSYERIARFVASRTDARYDAASGTVKPNILGPRTVAIAQFEHSAPPPYWRGAAILAREPLTLQTASAPWDYSVQLSVPDANATGRYEDGGQYWIRVDLEVLKGCVGISAFSPDYGPMGEQFFQQTNGTTSALIPLTIAVDRATSVMVRSGGQPSSVVRVYRAQLLYDPDPDSRKVEPVELGH